jgi:hypothetical protein
VHSSFWEASSHLTREFSTLYRIWRFITVLIRARCSESHESIPHFHSLKFHFTLSFQLCLDLLGRVFRSCFPPSFMRFSDGPVRATYSANVILLLGDLRFSGRWSFKSRSFGLWRRNIAVGYQRFGGHRCLHLKGERWYPPTTLHGVTTQKTLTWIFLLCLIILITFCQACKLWSSSFCNLLQLPATSSPLGANILLSTQFSDVLSLCYMPHSSYSPVLCHEKEFKDHFMCSLVTLLSKS